MSPQRMGEWASARLAATQKRCEDQSPPLQKEWSMGDFCGWAKTLSDDRWMTFLDLCSARLRPVQWSSGNTTFRTDRLKPDLAFTLASVRDTFLT